MKQTSEFGKGTAYCLGLFLAHAERYQEDKKVYESVGLPERAAGMWFNASSDHLFELVIPCEYPNSLKKRLVKFKSEVLRFGHEFPEVRSREKDVFWSINEAKELLRLIDKENGISAVKGAFE